MPSRSTVVVQSTRSASPAPPDSASHLLAATSSSTLRLLHQQRQECEQRPWRVDATDRRGSHRLRTEHARREEHASSGRWSGRQAGESPVACHRGAGLNIQWPPTVAKKTTTIEKQTSLRWDPLLTDLSMVCAITLACSEKELATCQRETTSCKASCLP